ncbi:MAG: hypothetical protein AAFR95_15145, partial [Bacteroidota bacterium]
TPYPVPMSSLRFPLRTTFACALALLLAACDFAGIQSDLEDATTVRLTVPAPPAEFAVTVIDATTQRPIDGEVRLTIAGDDAALVVDPLFFDPIDEVTTESGMSRSPCPTAPRSSPTPLSASR